MDIGSSIYQHVNELLADRVICGLLAFCFALIVIMTIDECVAVLNKNSKHDATTDYADHEEAKQEVDSEELKEVLDESSPEETPVIGVGGDSESNAVKKRREDKKSQGVVDDEGEKVKVLFDDWEGIERTDLEKRFGAAVAFVASKSNANRIRNEVKMQLQGLHKIATQGPCHAPQPMALKFSARSEWKAWQRLGDMSAESAMEQYLALLSSSTPGWEGSK